MEKIGLKIKGMHCISCEKRIRETVLELKGVKSAKVNYTTEKATIEFDPAETNVTNILKIIKDVGYEPELSQEKESKGVFKKLFV
jgi:Cu+-exporting ATPase